MQPRRQGTTCRDAAQAVVFVCLPSATVVIVVTVGTPEHREVEQRMSGQLLVARNNFRRLYGKYLAKDEVAA